MREDPLLELRERQAHTHGDAVTEHVEVAVGEVDDAPAAGVGDPRLADVPLPRDRPVEDLRARRYLGDLERNDPLKDLERPAGAVARDRAANRVQIPEQLVDLGSGLGLTRTDAPVDAAQPAVSQ